MYNPLCRMLTYLSINLAGTRSPAGQSLTLIRSSESFLHGLPEEARQKPDLLMLYAPKKRATEIINGTEAAFKGDRGLSAFSVIGCVEVKDDNKRADSQITRYLFSHSRHHPESFVRHGIVINKERFWFFSLGLEFHLVWDEVPWRTESRAISWSSISRLCMCIKIISEEACRGFPDPVPKFHSVLVPKVSGRNKKASPIGIFSAKLGEHSYSLLPIFSGRGNGRKPFIVIAVPGQRVEDARVFKYSWLPKDRLKTEIMLLEDLADAPGIVRIDSSASLTRPSVQQEHLQIRGSDLTFADPAFSGVNPRERCLFALTTLGYPLCSCTSVLEFLESMYDLLEVLRFLADEKDVLHRDVSWSNVLIRPKELGDKIDVRESIARAHMRPRRQDEQGIPHTYRFISDIFNEQDWRVRVALTDFDHATKRDNMDELKNATGTPMFMAHDVLNLRESLVMSPAGPCGNLSVLDDTDRNVAYKNLDGKYVLSDEKDAWDAFFREEYRELEWSIRPAKKNGAEIQRSFKHGAVHDAESVYYLCLLFFNRMWLYDKRVKEPEVADLQAKRGHLFKYLRDRKGHPTDLLAELPRECFDTDEQLTPFYDMLENIRGYLLVPWFNVASTGKGERYEFHLHDYMQRLLLEEISRMRNNGNCVRKEEYPLAVSIPVQVSGISFALLSSGLLPSVCILILYSASVFLTIVMYSGQKRQGSDASDSGQREVRDICN
ncbi:hypothetical protein ACEPAI_9703 [Sanghuangporus weigelae]